MTALSVFQERNISASGRTLKSFVNLPITSELSGWQPAAGNSSMPFIARAGQSITNVLEILDVDKYYELSDTAKSGNEKEIARKLLADGVIEDNMEGGFSVTNLGAILLAKEISNFPSIKHKSVRIIKYEGRDKRKTEWEKEGTRGYAVGFSVMLRWIMDRLPKEETYIGGRRQMRSHFPEVALREIIANALIHQDFTLTGSGPVVEIYSDRVEVTNPGASIVHTDRMIDERRSRNQKLAETLRNLGICEERGGGLDKAIIAIEENHLPAPEFEASHETMRIVIFGPRPFKHMSKADKQRACFFHCVIRYIIRDFMNNTSLRKRFSLEDEDYQLVSAVIAEAVRNQRIKKADPDQGNKFARYVPYWA